MFDDRLPMALAGLFPGDSYPQRNARRLAMLGRQYLDAPPPRSKGRSHR